MFVHWQTQHVHILFDTQIGTQTTVCLNYGCIWFCLTGHWAIPHLPQVNDNICSHSMFDTASTVQLSCIATATAMCDCV